MNKAFPFFLMSILFLTACEQKIERASEIPRTGGNSSSGNGSAVDNQAKSPVDGEFSQGDLGDQNVRHSVSSTRQDNSYLPFERRLLNGTTLSLKEVGVLLRSDDYDANMRAFANETAKDPDAQELTRRYETSISNLLSPSEQLNNFSCGLSICAGSIRTGADNSGYERWSELMFQKPPLPLYNFADRLVQLGGGQTENRFVFSIDPASNALKAPLQGKP